MPLDATRWLLLYDYLRTIELANRCTLFTCVVYAYNIIIIAVVELILVFAFSIRMQGSAALNMCSVASGAADFYYEYGIHVWDIAAAGIIAEEAGATLVDPSGKNNALIWNICIMRRITLNHNKIKVQSGFW